MTATETNDRRPWLLVSDIDDTLTGDDAALRRLADTLGRQRGSLWFAVNSSRPASSVSATIRDIFPGNLRPDAVITALGTEISLRGAPLPDWERGFSGWPHQPVFDLLSALGHRPHAAEFLTPRKVSFAVPAGRAQIEARAALIAAGIPCQVIASGRDDFDVIPDGAGKDAATLHLAAALGCTLSHLVVAGDSGNDLAMFRIAANRIAVANARPELIDRLEPGTFFHASRPHAAGVLEGLVHFGCLAAAPTQT